MEIQFSIAQNGLYVANHRLQTRAQNLSNLTTPGFKALLPQQADLYGPGARSLGTAQDFTALGTPEQTGMDGHVFIQGDGFFRVSRDGEPAYTRLGNFQVDRDGNLVTPTGHLLDPAITVPEDAVGIEVSTDGLVFAIDSEGAAVEVGQLELVRFQNPNGLLAIGDNLYAQGPNAGDALAGTPGDVGFGTIGHRMLEGSNVDPAHEITQQIVDQRSYQMNLRVFQTADALVSRAIDLFS